MLSIHRRLLGARFQGGHVSNVSGRHACRHATEWDERKPRPVGTKYGKTTKEEGCLKDDLDALSIAFWPRGELRSWSCMSASNSWPSLRSRIGQTCIRAQRLRGIGCNSAHILHGV